MNKFVQNHHTLKKCNQRLSTIEETTTATFTSAKNSKQGPRSVRFHPTVVTNVVTRPLTSDEDKRCLYFSRKEILKSQEEERLKEAEKELIMKIIQGQRKKSRFEDRPSRQHEETKIQFAMISK